MAFYIVRDDITKVKADIIVNTANPHVAIGDGVDRAIYEAAGSKELLREREMIGELPCGKIAVTNAYRLPAKYIIHASGPVWNGGLYGEEELLRVCFEKSLAKAYELRAKSIAFPLMSTGTYGFPREKALEIAARTATEFLKRHEMEIILVVFDQKTFTLSEKMFGGLQQYIDDHYVESHVESQAENHVQPITTRFLSNSPSFAQYERDCRNRAHIEAESEMLSPISYSDVAGEIGDLPEVEEDSFVMYLQQLINKKRMKNAQVYKKANLTKQYFSKLMHGQINPTKEKLLSIAIALELNLDETNDFLRMGGYALSPCSKSDVVITYFIKEHKYDIISIEIALDDLHLPTLSSY